jgi:hypothetical protein
MATFTETEQLNIGKILGIQADHLTDLLAYRVEGITDEVVLQVQTELANWLTYSTKFTKLHPTESNKGVETYPEKMQGMIQANIANLLFLSDYVNTGGNYLPRG